MDFVERWFASLESMAGLLQPAAAILVFALFLLLRGLLTRFVFGLASKVAARSKTRIDIGFFLALEKPLKNFILILGLYVALSILPLDLTVGHYITVIFRILVAASIAWALYNLAGSRPFKALSRRYGLDPLLADFFTRAIKALIVAMAVFMVLDQIGYNINGFIAGLGLGGLAVALAAKDALANIFAGIVIITDKPFSVGDWIETPEIEGTVEQLSFRSTKIRTFAQALVTVPNAVLANEAITNWSRMEKRRVTFHLSVALSTPRGKLERAVSRIRLALQEHPDIHPDTILVHFEQFGEDSLKILFYFFTKTTVYAEYLAAKESINLRIMEIMESEGVSPALPARRILINSPEK